jgi:hypothetical protein
MTEVRHDPSVATIDAIIAEIVKVGYGAQLAHLA